MKFAECTFNKIWDSAEGQQIVTQILQDPNLIHANHTIWQKLFKVDPKITPTNQEGEAVFTSKMRELTSGVMMDVRAPLGDSVPEDTKGAKYYSGIIPEFITRGTVEKATERDYRKQLFEQFGDASLIAEYATEVLQGKVDSINQTLSHMATQLNSTGKIVYQQGEGFQGGLLKADVPAENFVKAGKVVWTNPECKLLDQIREIYNGLMDDWGVEISMQLEITRDVFNSCFLNNNQVKEWVRYVNVINNTPLPETMVLTRDMVLPALAKFEGLPQIVIVEEAQKDINNGVVHGWKANTAVLRPLGYAGLIRRASINDVRLFKEYGNNVNTYSFTSIANGLGVLRNFTIVNGNFKEWHTDAVLAAVPSLDEFLYHVIIDIASANE